MWTDTDIEFLIGLIGSNIATDFGLDTKTVEMSIQQTLNDLAATRENARRAALKRCTFEVIQGGRNG